MPIPPPAVTAPYDTLETVLNLARSRVNDVMQSLAGEILADAQPYTQTYANAAWFDMQQYLAQLGHARFKNRCILENLPPKSSTILDPAVLPTLSWTQYYDGSGYFAPPQVAVLPQDWISPLWIKERQTGLNTPFLRMHMAEDGIFPEFGYRLLNRFWNWQQDTLQLGGAQVNFDLEAEYASYSGDFVTAGGVLWQNQPVPLMRARSAFADFIAAEFCGPRGDESAQGFRDSGELKLRRLYNVQAQQKQRTTTSRRRFSSAVRPSWGGNRGSGYGAF